MNITIKPFGIIAAVAISTILVVKCASSSTDDEKSLKVVKPETPTVVLVDSLIDSLKVKKIKTKPKVVVAVAEKPLLTDDPMLGEQSEYVKVPLLEATVYKFKRVSPTHVKLSFELYGNDGNEIQQNLATRYVPSTLDTFAIGKKYYVALLTREERTVYASDVIVPFEVYGIGKGDDKKTVLCFTYKDSVYQGTAPQEWKALKHGRPISILLKY